MLLSGLGKDDTWKTWCKNSCDKVPLMTCRDIWTPRDKDSLGNCDSHRCHCPQWVTMAELSIVIIVETWMVGSSKVDNNESKHCQTAKYWHCAGESTCSKGRIQSKIWCMGTYGVVEYYLIISRLQSRQQHIYHGIGQPYARVGLNPMPESTLFSSPGLRIWPLVWKVSWHCLFKVSGGHTLYILFSCSLLHLEKSLQALRYKYSKRGKNEEPKIIVKRETWCAETFPLF